VAEVLLGRIFCLVPYQGMCCLIDLTDPFSTWQHVLRWFDKKLLATSSAAVVPNQNTMHHPICVMQASRFLSDYTTCKVIEQELQRRVADMVCRAHSNSQSVFSEPFLELDSVLRTADDALLANVSSGLLDRVRDSANVDLWSALDVVPRSLQPKILRDALLFAEGEGPRPSLVVKSCMSDMHMVLLASHACVFSDVASVTFQGVTLGVRRRVALHPKPCNWRCSFNGALALCPSR
jgi:hypothetical protein